MRLSILISLLCMSLSLLGLGHATAQSSAEGVLYSVGQSLVDNNASTLSQFFDDQVELNLVGRSQMVSRTQAQYVMNNFFARNPHTAYTVLHRGYTGNGTFYALAEYRSDRGAYEVNIFIKTSTQRVTELRFSRK